jgi:hypothetical protein
MAPAAGSCYWLTDEQDHIWSCSSVSQNTLVKSTGTIEEGESRNKNTALIIVHLTHLSTPSPKENVVYDLAEIFRTCSDSAEKMYKFGDYFRDTFFVK